MLSKTQARRQRKQKASKMANKTDIEHPECPACNGTGWIGDTETAGLRSKCGKCGGRGHIMLSAAVPDKVLMIGIETMMAVKNMAPVLKLAKNKEDMLYVLKEMQQTIKDGQDAIDSVIEGE